MNFIEGSVRAVRPWGLVVTTKDGRTITAKNALSSNVRRKQAVIVSVDDAGRMSVVGRPRS